MLSFLLIFRTVHSPFGQVLKAIRENEPRATSLGYDVARFKLLAFVLSAALAGLAGASKTLVLGFATLTDAHWSTSGLVILMVLVGGMGTMLGPILGAVIVVALENKVGDIGSFLGRTTGIEWFNGLGRSCDDRHRFDLRHLRDGISTRLGRRVPGVVVAPPRGCCRFAT